MDKLKPILAHKFWLLFGIVLIMPVVGYFMTKGGLAATIEARRTALEGKEKSITTGNNSPNEQWIAGLKDINVQQALKNRLANDQLWKVQRERMRWPDDIAVTMKTAEYFKAPSSADKASDVQYKYVNDYPEEARHLWQIVDPQDDGKNQRDSDAKRKVIFEMSDLHLADNSRWSDLAPNLNEVWAAQEDIWLQTELLSAVKRVNQNSQTLMDSFIKQIGKVQLFGGAKVASEGAAASGDVQGDMPADRGGGLSSPFGSSGFGGEAPGSLGGGSRFSGGGTSSIDIPLSEEFTVTQESTAGVAEGGIAALNGPVESSVATPAVEGGGTPNAATESVDTRRYIDFVEGQPFKRRGFYIKLVMDHRKVPELVAELMNSPFPVEIIRIHQTAFGDSGLGGAAGPGGSNPLFGGGAPGGFGGSPGSLAGGGKGGLGRGAGIIEASSGGLAGEDFGGGVGGRLNGAGGFGGRADPSATPGQSAMADPNLANVAILAVWTLYTPPPATPDGAGNAQPSTGASAPSAGNQPGTTETPSP